MTATLPEYRCRVCNGRHFYLTTTARGARIECRNTECDNEADGASVQAAFEAISKKQESPQETS